jgi:hypothetical protein
MIVGLDTTSAPINNEFLINKFIKWWKQINYLIIIVAHLKKKFQHIKKIHMKTYRNLLKKSYVFFQFSLNPIIVFEERLNNYAIFIHDLVQKRIISNHFNVYYIDHFGTETNWFHRWTDNNKQFSFTWPHTTWGIKELFGRWHSG